MLAEQVPTDAELGFCPIARAARLLGDTWTLLIIYNLAAGPRRFSDLEKATGMSPRVLAGRLRELEGQHMLTRTQYPEIPPRVEYALTEKGRAAAQAGQQVEAPAVEAARAGRLERLERKVGTGRQDAPLALAVRR